MPGVYSFFRCLAEAVVVKAPKGILGLVPGGEFVHDVAVEAWERWRKVPDASPQALNDQLHQAASTEQADPQAFASQMRQLVEQVAPRAAPEVQRQLADYLTLVPARIRATFRRPQDRAGLTAPPNWTARNSRDLEPILPPRLPRFKPGDRPPGAEKYELVRRLGMGGFGEVWLARHTQRQGYHTAFKFCLDPDARVRLVRHEARIVDQVLSQVSHPNIVRLLEVDYDGDTPWLQFEYVAGGDLTALTLPRDSEKRARLATKIIRNLAETVAHCHRLNPPVVHRDLKPANILVSHAPSGNLMLKITDFGIGDIGASQTLEQARRDTRHNRSLSIPSLVRGAHTPLYASPEQQDPTHHATPDPADDVHALGVLWYQLLMGDLTMPLGRDYRDDLADLGLCPELVEVLSACVASKRARRLANAGVLADKIAGLPSELLHTNTPGPPRASSLDQHLEVVLSDAEQRNTQARQQVQNHDYAGAISTLEGIRLDKFRDDALYFEAKKNRDRVNELEQIIGPRVLNGPHEGLLDLVDELLRLVPTHAQMGKVAERLRQYQDLRQFEAQRRPKAGSKFTSKESGIEMVRVATGAFWMGGGGGKAGERRVVIPHDFYLGIYPVTQRHWQPVMGNNPSHFMGDDLPVERVSWDEVQEFLQKLNEREKGTSGWVYRLPTEAEWEYACRCPASFSGGELSKHHCSFDFYFDTGPTNSLSSTQANFDGNYPYVEASTGPYLRRTTRVGSHRPNGLGIYDMHGNVWEWCQDLFDGGPRRVIRGGSWYSSGERCRAAFRYDSMAINRHDYIGFRLVLSPAR